MFELILGILFLSTILWNFTRIESIVVALPRDILLMSRYVSVMIFCKYCSYTNQTVARYFDSVAKKNLHKACFYYEDQIWTYRKVQKTSLLIAKYFHDEGYKKGDVVGLFMENRPEYVCIWLGLSRIGVSTSLLNYNLRLKSLEHCLNASKCKSLIFGTELTEAIDEVLQCGGLADLKLYSMDDHNQSNNSRIISQPHTNLNNELENMELVDVSKIQFNVQTDFKDVFLHMFTSGTTGMPKAVVITHTRYFAMAPIRIAIGLNPKKDILITPIPLYHAQGGIVGTSCPLIHGIPQVILRKFSASNFWKQCIKYEATCSSYMGEIIRYLNNQPERPEDKLHSIHTFFGNGVNRSIWASFVNRFNTVDIKEIYGATEGNGSLLNFFGQIGAVGYFPVWAYRFLPYFIAKVDKITGEFVRDPRSGLIIHAEIDEPGEFLAQIQTGNPMREFSGYTDKLETNKKMVKDVKKKDDLWFRSGDMLSRDALGYFYFKDRSGETFRWKGENVSTAEVEEVLTKASGYKSVAVYGVEVPGYEGKCGMAAISDPQGTLDLEKFYIYIFRQLPPYARPLFTRVYDSEIQMTGTFKLQKVDMQKEGFDIRVVPQPIYFLHEGKYSTLNASMYEQIVSGKLRL